MFRDTFAPHRYQTTTFRLLLFTVSFTIFEAALEFFLGMTMGRISAVLLLFFASTVFRTSRASRDDDGMIRVGTWNVLLMDDEYHPSWGCPLQITLCSDKKQACTLERRRRVWETIENNTLEMDVLCLQEADDAFFYVQSESSNWTTVARNGECSVLLSDASGFRVSDVYDVALSGLSGCPLVPMVTLLRSSSSNGESEKAVVVGSLHLKSSLSNVETGTKWQLSLSGMRHPQKGYLTLLVAITITTSPLCSHYPWVGN
jgi:hypothetical protein